MGNPWKDRRKPRPGAIATGVLAAVLLFDIGADVGYLWICSQGGRMPTGEPCGPTIGIAQGIAFKAVAMFKLLETGATRPSDAGRFNQFRPPMPQTPRGP